MTATRLSHTSLKQACYFLMPRTRRSATDATASSLTKSQAGEGLRADDVGRTAIRSSISAVSSQPSPILLHTESTVRALSAKAPTPEDFEDYVRNSKS